MFDALGGKPKRYSGQLPIDAHRQIMITSELFDLRTSLLEQALADKKAPTALTEKWIKIDGAFRSALIKNNLSECKRRFFTDEIQNFENPNQKKAA